MSSALPLRQLRRLAVSIGMLAVMALLAFATVPPARATEPTSDSVLTAITGAGAGITSIGAIPADDDAQAARCMVCGSALCSGFDLMLAAASLDLGILPASVFVPGHGTALRVQQPRAPPQSAASPTSNFDPRGPPSLG